MPTNKKRIYVTLSRDQEEAINILAKQEETPPATKAAQLIQFALEVAEEDILDQIAHKRDLESNELLTHEDAWK